MSANIQARTNASWMFSGMGSGAGTAAGSNFLSDYASIKNGSYRKLMKAYYSSNASDSVKSVAAQSMNRSSSRTTRAAQTAEETKAFNKVQTTSDALKESANTLLKTGAKSIFNKKDVITKDEKGVETTAKEYDKGAIYDAVNGFVNNYNSVIQAADKVDSNSVSRRTANMMNSTAANMKSLASVGISVNKDGTLALDKDTFMNSDMSKAKNLFNGNNSYAYRVSAQASMINYAADNEMNKGYAYTSSGNYGANYNNGNLFNSWL